MSLDSAWNMYIFREGKNVLRGPDLANALTQALAQYSDQESESKRRTHLLDLLLRAGELECALADCHSPQTGLVATITDELAASLVSNAPVSSEDLARRAALIEAPEHVSVAPPEGFAYYSLHPLDFLETVRRVELHSRFAAVVGIRSIGTTLSAVVQAALRAEGLHAERITVRPSGHPYDRETRFGANEAKWIAFMLSHGAEFLVVDEGPGMSGSSFLSVGDALLSAGVPRARISFLCTREPYPPSLTAPKAAVRWPSFRSYYTRSTQFLPEGAAVYIAGGIWRGDVFKSEEDWPASWLQMERLKFLSKDRQTYFGFEGFGRFGEEVRNRAVAVGEAGFGPVPAEREEGFGVYPMLNGRTLSARDASPKVLRRIAKYCTFRAEHVTADVEQNPELETMLRFNVEQEFGVPLAEGESKLPIVKPVIADARMLPHKWIEAGGDLLKVDCCTHGDNHFFPGPTDIAWDLAGTIVEWDLCSVTKDLFVSEYEKSSGDAVQGRLPAYLLAYSIFRMAYCKMASAAMRGTEEEHRLTRDYRRYREYARQYLSDLAKANQQHIMINLPSTEIARGAEQRRSAALEVFRLSSYGKL